MLSFIYYQFFINIIVYVLYNYFKSTIFSTAVALPLHFS